MAFNSKGSPSAPSACCEFLKRERGVDSVMGITRPGHLVRELGVDPRGVLNSSSRGRECPPRLGQASLDLIATSASAVGRPQRRDLAELPRPLQDGYLPGE